VKVSPVPNKGMYKLLRGFPVAAFGEVYEIPAGFMWDGASIPRFFWRIIGGPFRPEFMKASCIHDWMCVNKPPHSTSAKAAEYFGNVLRNCGVPKRKALLMVKAVKWFGPKWK